MDFSITKEQGQLRDEIIRFSKENLNDEKDMYSFSRKCWDKSAEFGMFGLSVPEEYGGLGESYLTSAIAIEALGYACNNNGFVFAVNNHIWVALNLILLYGTKEQKDRYIPAMVRGELIGAMAISEADSGSDANGMLTNAELDGDSYVLNGTKMFVSNGSIANLFIVFAKCKIKNKEKIAAFILEKDKGGISAGRDIEKMGLESCPMSELIIDGYRVSKDNVLASIDVGDSIMKSALEWERCYEFASHLGAMQRVMEQCLEYVEKRKQFGKTLSEFQAVTHKIADMRVRIELSKRLLYEIAWLKDNKKSAYLEASVFKLYTSEAYIQTCKDAMQIFGAYGYTKEYGIERELRDALASSIYSGTTEIQKNTIYSITSLGL